MMAEITDEEVTLFLRRMTKVRRQIMDHIAAAGKQKKFVQDSIPCPLCDGGTVSYMYSGHYNGHIHAQCSTAGCIQWME